MSSISDGAGQRTISINRRDPFGNLRMATASCVNANWRTIGPLSVRHWCAVGRYILQFVFYRNIIAGNQTHTQP